MDESDLFEKTFMVKAPVQRAFDVFTRGFHTWWPHEYTWSGEVLDTIAIEPQKGGRCFERGPHNFECDWGRVLEWKPPHKLVFTWQISPNRVPEPDPGKVSEVEIRLDEESEKETRVTFIHRNFSKHGEGAEAYRKAMSSEKGWPDILKRYQIAAEED